MRIVSIANNQTWHEKLAQLRAIEAATGGRVRYVASNLVVEQYVVEELSDLLEPGYENASGRAAG